MSGTVDVWRVLTRRSSAARRAREEVAMNETAPNLFDAPLPDPTVPRVELVGRDHPSTAKAAASLVAPKAATERGKIIAAMVVRAERYDRAFDAADDRRLPPCGATAAEMAEVIGSSRNQTAARMLTLRAQGWLEYAADESGELLTRETGGGFRGRVHVLTAVGRAQWRAASDVGEV